jgi:hypothetical protein
VWFAHDCDNGYLSQTTVARHDQRNQIKSSLLIALTPLAVRIGRALSLGNNAFLYLSGMALMMSTSRGTPPNPCFLLIFARISFKDTVWLASWALISSAAIPAVTRRSSSEWDGPFRPNEMRDCVVDYEVFI